METEMTEALDVVRAAREATAMAEAEVTREWDAAVAAEAVVLSKCKIARAEAWIKWEAANARAAEAAATEARLKMVVARRRG